MNSEDPSPALLAARERSRVAEDRLRQHLLGGGSTRSFRQAQPAEIVQSISPQTYQVNSFNAAWLYEHKPSMPESSNSGPVAAGLVKTEEAVRPSAWREPKQCWAMLLKATLHCFPAGDAGTRRLFHGKLVWCTLPVSLTTASFTCRTSIQAICHPTNLHLALLAVLLSQGLEQMQSS